jgi:hypothetical protein
MMRRLLLLIGLGSLAIGPALPDIIDVAVNGSVSGSGELTFACAPVTPGCASNRVSGYFLSIPYSFSGTNTQLGEFNVLRSLPRPGA